MGRRYEQHRAMYDAVRSGDGVEAERLMRVHARLDTTAETEPVG
jgi:DNA-binding GntR family transcriptional regulator